MNPHALKIAQILEQHFPNPYPPLYHLDTFTLLIAVLLSARSTDATVNKVTPCLFAQAATPAAMLSLSVETIRLCIQPCGLSKRKAFAIHALSWILEHEYEGKVPACLETLKKLPGIGHKTASVVMVQGFNTPAFPVDTHIFRSARRWKLSQSNSVVGVERDLKALFPEHMWGKLHLQMIFFARLHCPARKHDSRKCPICSWISKN